MDQLWLSAPASAMRLWPPGVGAHSWRLNPAAAAWAHRRRIERLHWDAIANLLREALGSTPPMLEGRMAAGPDAVQINWTAVQFEDGWVVWLIDHADRPVEQGHAEATVARWLHVLNLASSTAWRMNLVTGRAHFSGSDYHALTTDALPTDISIEEARDQVHPDDRAAEMRVVDEAMASTQAVDTEARYLSKHGGYLPLLIRRVAERDEAGNVIALSGVSLDMSVRVAERERAAAFVHRTDMITNAAGVGIWSADQETGQVEWNAQMYRIYGLPEGEEPPHEERWLQQFVHPEDRDNARRSMTLVAAGTPGLQSNYRILRADGAVRWISAWSRREHMAGREMAFGINLDVTDLQQAQAELRRSQERAQLAAESAGIGMWERDLFNGVSNWDAQVFRLRGHAPDCGFTPDELRHTTCHPDDRTLFDMKLELAAREGRPLAHEFRVVWPDGSVHWIATRGLVQRDAQTGHKRIFGVNWDITEQKLAEQTLREKAAAEQASAAKSEFLARMSHELRTPLNAVLGFAQLLSDDRTEFLSPQQHQRVDRIQTAGLHLLALIDDVLDLATIESDAVPLELEPVSLQDVLDDVRVWTHAQAAQADVVVHVPALSGWVLADPRRMRQVVSNLMSNAIKYNRAAGEVWIAEEACEIDGRPGWRLRVRDSGIGLSPEQCRNLYQPFNRLGAERGSVQGTGIGLAIVHHLVRRMGGLITVQSQLQMGTEFEIVLQASEPAAPFNAPAVSGFQPDLNGIDGSQRLSVLYIEDNPVNVLLVQELLSLRSDVRLSVATDGLSGVRDVLESRPDVVLIDLELPDISGFEVQRRLRADGSLNHTKMIALSANAMAEDVRQALAEGFDDYWAKPIDLQAFTRALNRLVLAHAERLRG
jgi:PAS domain S-box-containing protein